MAASTTTITTIPLQLRRNRIPQVSVRSCCSYVLRNGKDTCIRFQITQVDNLFTSKWGGTRPLIKPTSATDSGLEASIADTEDVVVALKNAKIVVVSQDNNKMQLRADLNGIETQKVFDRVLTNLARTAPPVPGFRRQKGVIDSNHITSSSFFLLTTSIPGKTSKVPKDFLLQILGEDRVIKFVIQEIVSSTIAQYVKEEKLNVKDNKINTTQSAAELKSSFNPGHEFGFNATLELETSENVTS